MNECTVCGERLSEPYYCQHCEQAVCGTHFEPETHDCPALADDDGADDPAAFDGGIVRAVAQRGDLSEDQVMVGMIAACVLLIGIIGVMMLLG
ncbi:hypothetical protein BRD17_05880 [Halobacteriales archaeon SW_7_68_16]|nr:MAG: hypothetical protein BRD17_05880 [Halobacteriales archaeon SW_7_68_16]